MAITNREQIGKGLDLLARGLRPFIERELRSRLGSNWQEGLPASDNRPGRPTPRSVNLDDPHTLLTVLWDQWNAVFRNVLGPAERSIISELREARNRWAHHEQFSSNDAIRALDSIERLLNAVSAADDAAQVGQMRLDVMRSMFEEQRRSEMRKKAFQPTEGKPQGGLKPWREVVTPHPDVASGRYQQAEFAADLWQVYQGEGSDEYKNPTEFFRRTFITEGLRCLLSQGILRLASNDVNRRQLAGRAGGNQRGTSPGRRYSRGTSHSTSTPPFPRLCKSGFHSPWPRCRANSRGSGSTFNRPARIKG